MENREESIWPLFVIMFGIGAFFHFFNEEKKTNVYYSTENSDSAIDNNEKLLNRIDAKLVKVLEGLGKSPSAFDRIYERAGESDIILTYYIKQLILLRTNQLYLAPAVDWIPNILRNEYSKAFDECTDQIVYYYRTVKFYTKEEANLLRKSCLSRTMKAADIEFLAKSKIRQHVRFLLEREYSYRVSGDDAVTSAKVWCHVNDLMKDKFKIELLLSKVEGYELKTLSDDTSYFRQFLDDLESIYFSEQSVEEKKPEENGQTRGRYRLLD